MFLEALVPRDDLRAFLARALPLTILLDAPGGSHSLVLSDLAEVTIVPEMGVQIVCTAHLHWPVLGIDAPLTLNALRVLLIPEVRPSPSGEILAFRFALEHLDIPGVPSIFDEKIAGAVNERMAANHVELAWDFSRTFANVVPLPSMLAELDALTLRAAWGKVKITEEAVVFALSLHTALVRVGDAPGVVAPPAPNDPAPAPLERAEPPPRPATSIVSLAAVALFGLAAGIAFFSLRRVSTRW